MASAKEGEGAGRGPCGLRNSELGPLPHTFDDFIYGLTVWQNKKFLFSHKLQEKPIL